MATKARHKDHHKPQTVRGINDWLRRVEQEEFLRVRTIHEKGIKYLGIQRRIADCRTIDWRTIVKADVNDYDGVISYLQKYAPTDWKY